jgi:hypothetical protein
MAMKGIMVFNGNIWFELSHGTALQANQAGVYASGRTQNGKMDKARIGFRAFKKHPFPRPSHHPPP